MSDLQKYIKKRKSRDPDFAVDYDSGYEQFKIGIILKKNAWRGWVNTSWACREIEYLKNQLLQE